MNELLGLCLLGTLGEPPYTKQSLSTHDMEDKDLVSVVPIEDSARQFYELTIARFAELLRATAAFRVIGKLFYMVKNALDELCGCGWVLKRDIVRNCVKVRLCRIRPDYFSHLARRFLAWA